jgi:hypothetical protein
MRDDRSLGFITPSGIITGILTILIVVAVGFARGGALFSPGRLNAKVGATLGGVTSHADLASKCQACHPAFWEKATMADRCLVCHTDISSQQQDPATLHGNLQKNSPRLVCQNCHPDHGNASARLAEINVVNLTHKAFGYALTAHKTQADGTPFTCKDCHGQNYVKFDQAPCQTCHQQIKADFMQSHLQGYGPDCLACHDGIDTYAANFDHNKASFQLTGKHAQAACTQCHTDARSIADLRGAPTDCASCHGKSNPHSEQLGTSCEACHTTDGWLPATFDHKLASFQLSGKHVQVACSACHVNNLYKGTPTGCHSCHQKDDKHNGQYGPDCSLCHKPSGWPTTFNHAIFTFKLSGKHLNVACTGCHQNGNFKGTPTDCNSCHAKSNPHSDRLGTNCGNCHTPGGWQPATFDHALAAYPLSGKHNQVACTGCHVNNDYRGIPTDCYSCHKKDDKHNGQYGTDCSLCHKPSGWPTTFNHDLFPFTLTGQHINVACTSCHANLLFNGTPTDCNSCHASKNPHSALLGANCGSCHTTSGWLPATFDHNLAAFKLTGAHVQVACTNCHASNVYKGTPATCNACHAQNDHHNGQFGTDCGACHTTSAWLPATFDHNLAAFQLTGAHSNVACSSCHVNNVYKGTPTNCYACHAANDHHNGQYGTDCGACHATSAWLPANFNHSIFPLTNEIGRAHV